MRTWRKSVAVIGVAAAIFAIVSSSALPVTKTFDRKFPLTFCPFDLSGWQGPGGPTDLSFVAPASSVRLVFSTPNYFNGGYVRTHLDNVTVVLKSQFPDNPANVHPPSPSGLYYSCSFPPSGTEADATHAPSFLFSNFTWPGPAGPLLSRFDSGAECWTGDVYHDVFLGAPTDPATETVGTVGSLGVGVEGLQLPGMVTASRIVTGLVPGQVYMVFAWWHAEQVDTPLAISVDSAVCLDPDGDGYVDCSGCAPCELQAGQTCGDCNEADASIHSGASDATCDGIDQNCSGAADEGFPGGCLCDERGTGLVGWWPAEGNANDLIGSNNGTPRESGVFYFPGYVGQAAYFAYGQPGGLELPAAAALNFTSQVTLEAWIRADEMTESSRPIISKLGSPFDYAYGLQTQPGGFLEAAISSNGTNLDTLDSPAGALSPGVWAHVAMTFDAGVWKLYINGQVVASKLSTVTSIYNQGSAQANIGRSPDGSLHFVGYMDEVAMYSRALGADEIRAIFNADATGMCQCTDADHDGYGIGGLSCPGGTQMDCNDANPAFHPGQAEACNGLDDDCDGVIDEGLSQTTFYQDMDMDGYGTATTTIQACAAPPGYVAAGTDCNDADPTVHPGIPDAICNGIDDDCNGQVDDSFPGGCACVERVTGLVGWYKGEGNANNQPLNNNGTLMGTASFAAGEVGQSFSLDGAGWVELPDAPDFEFTSQMTLEAWIRPDDVSAYRQVLSKMGAAGNYAYQIGLASGGVLRADLSANGTLYYTITSPPGTLSVGSWAHVAVTFNSGDWRLYVNGNLVNALSIPPTSIFAAGSTKPNIGRDPAGIQQFLGRIDEVALYNRALSASEIHAVFAIGGTGMCPCRDGDRDGYGEQGGVLCYAGTVADCNNFNASVHPGATELCNGVDDNCNGQYDDGLPQSTFYLDADNDGYGNAAVTISSCAAPAGFVANSTDCNDANYMISPGFPEQCNLIDDNCNNIVDLDYASPPDGWIPTPGSQVPSARIGMTMVSTGNSVIVWGGLTTAIPPLTNTGGIHRPINPATDFWTPTSLDPNVPEARYYHSAVWTGTEMIVWGGVNGSNVKVLTGGRYRPSTNSWTPTSTGVNVPAVRAYHTAVWTGSKMIIWGGVGSSIVLNTGAIYDPSSNTWATMSTTGAPSPRQGHIALWTGTEMIIWGGWDGFSGSFNDGARYNPTTNTWIAMTSPGAMLSPRTGHTAVWTGTQMVVWGGTSIFAGFYVYRNDGAIYNLATNSWVWSFAGLSAREGHTAVWDPVDGLMAIWGGYDGSFYHNDGGIYNPVTHVWSSLPAGGFPPQARSQHAAVWLSAIRNMLVWGGGTTGGSYLSTGDRIVVAPFTCGLGECQHHSSYTCTSGALGYGCTAGTPATEVCNGLDDNCDGTADNGIPAPSGSPLLSVDGVGPSQLSWSAVSGVTGYDVVGGDLGSLHGSGGNFTTSTTLCLGNDLAGTSVPDGAAPPAVGTGVWYLTRAVNSCGGNGSYNDGSPGLQGSRDAEIAASAAACP